MTAKQQVEQYADMMSEECVIHEGDRFVDVTRKLRRAVELMALTIDCIAEEME